MIVLAAPGRTTQAPYIDETLRENASQAFSARVRHDLLTNLDQAYDLATLAAAHHVSTRTMLRRFRAETGLTPWTSSRRRASRAQSFLLESTSLSVPRSRAQSAITTRVRSGGCSPKRSV
jgi:transcriptional regulator GlxA family with amidase domain